MHAAAPLRVLPAQLARRPRASTSRAATCAQRAGRPALRATVCSSSRALSAAVAEKAVASSVADKAVALAQEPAPPRFGSSIPRGDTAGAALVIEDVSVQAGDRDLLTDASLRVLPGQRVGLVGANGCGKSTLLRTICGLRLADSGRIACPAELEVAYLEQVGVSGSSKTVWEEARSRMTHVIAAEQAVEKALAGVAADLPQSAEQLAAAQSEFEAVGGYEADKRISNVLSGLGFKQADFNALASSFSGGWQMRIALARTLLSPAGDAARGAGRAPGLLMLDEPTNHLDNAACAWLADFLRSSGGTVLLVSHDEALLETCTHIAEVRGGKLHHFTGTYTDFLAARTLRDEQALSQAMAAQAEIARTEAFMAKFGAKTAFANAAKSRAKMLDKLRENAAELPVAASSAGGGDRTKASMRFPKPPPCHREIIKLTDASVGWNGTPLLSKLNLTIEKGQRVLVLGPNGAGKSTLLRAIAGAETLLSGEHQLGEGAKIGYFVQDLAQELPLDKPALEYVLDTAREDDPNITTEEGRKALGALGLLGDTPLRRIGELSGGEKSRVALARFALVSNNVLLLDEVSNHLDAATIDMLTSALQSYEGAIVAITHNKLFAGGLNATHVLRVEGGQATLKPNLGALADADFAESKKPAQAAAGVPRKTPKKAKAPTAEEELEAMRAAARQERYALAGNSTAESDSKPKSKQERLAAKKAAEEKAKADKIAAKKRQPR